MHKVTPIKHEDGTETVRLYGKTVDVTGKSKFTLFKREYKVYRPRSKKVGKLKADVVIDTDTGETHLENLAEVTDEEK